MLRWRNPDDAEAVELDAAQLRLEIGSEELQRAVALESLAVVAVHDEALVPLEPGLRTHFGERDLEIRELDLAGNERHPAAVGDGGHLPHHSEGLDPAELRAIEAFDLETEVRRAPELLFREEERELSGTRLGHDDLGLKLHIKEQSFLRGGVERRDGGLGDERSRE